MTQPKKTLDKYLTEAADLYGDVWEAIRNSLVRLDQVMPNLIAPTIMRAVAPFRNALAANLAESNIATWILGMDSVFRLFPRWVHRDLEQRPIASNPIEIASWLGRGSDGPPRIGFDDLPDPSIRYPVILNSAQRLAETNVLTRDQWNRANAIAKQEAFFITDVQVTDTIEKVRDHLIDDLREGTSLDTFTERAGDILRKSGIGESRIETIYRTGAQSAFRDGRETVMQDPIVKAAFPYQQYNAIHDARARPDHLILESLGLSGTNVYRTDDPFWDYFTPPWGFNCRCNVTLMTLESAARAGVKEAQRWIDSGSPPDTPEFRLADVLKQVEPEPNFGARGRKGVLVV